MQEESYNAFQELNIFENVEANQVCDYLIHFTKQLTNEDLTICGSMSLVFDGQLPESYNPKDVDFVASRWAFRMLKGNLKQMDGVLMIEKRPHRIVLYLYSQICVEIWEDSSINDTKIEKLYNNKIKYII